MKKLFLLLFSSGSIMVSTAQSIGPSVINASGNSGTIAGNTYEWSIGELITATYTGSSLIVTQGILQPRLATTGVVNVPPKLDGLKVYPNPVTDGMLYLSPVFKTGGKLTCHVTDAAGKTVLTQSTELRTGIEQQSIALDLLANGQYNLTVLWKDSDGQSSATYKIQKIR